MTHASFDASASRDSLDQLSRDQKEERKKGIRVKDAVANSSIKVKRGEGAKLNNQLIPATPVAPGTSVAAKSVPEKMQDQTSITEKTVSPSMTTPDRPQVCKMHTLCVILVSFWKIDVPGCLSDVRNHDSVCLSYAFYCSRPICGC